MGIKVLDCTLRDGAYVLDSMFGEECISGIISSLSSCGIDIIECGWLKDFEKKEGSVFYNQPQDLIYQGKNLALMFDYGRYDVNKLKQKRNVDIIRIAFYKEDLDRISFVAEEVKNKGYKVFLQASNTIAYSEKEIETLCKRANFLGGDSVYIVDSCGSMYPENLDKIIAVYDEIVDKNIEIGFHSHNNMQLSLALSMQFIKCLSDRNILVDSSLCGIGRGAGNTQTELLVEYLNKNGSNYQTEFVWDCIKKYIAPLYKDYHWGYTPQMGLKGIKGLHPNTQSEW